MKKLLSILTLLLCVCSGAWAQETLFSMTVKSDHADWGTTKDDATTVIDQDLTDAEATITGGTVHAYAGSGSTNYVIRKQNNIVWFAITQSGSNAYFKLTLDKAVAVGDVITYDILASNSDKGVGLKFGSSTSNGTGPEVSKDKSNKTLNHTYTVKEGDVIAGATEIYVLRNTGTSTYFNNLVITRPAAKTNWDKPTISYEYNPEAGKYNVTITSDDSAPTLTYKIGEDGAEQAYSAPFAVAPSVTVYAQASGTGYEASGWASEEIPAVPAVAAPSYQVGPWDYDNNGYAVTLKCPDAEASYVYMTTGSNAEGSTLDWSGATACTNGQVIYVRGYRIAIKGERTGYTTSYDPTGSRYSLSSVIPTGVSPELIVENTGNNSGEANADHGNRAVTITGNHYAGRIGENYLKMRIKPNGQSNNQLKIDVKDGFVVTAISFDKIQANTDYAIPVSSVTVDDETLAGFTAFDIPESSGTALENKVVSLGSGAKSSIVFAFGATSATQYNATITVTYEKIIPGPADPVNLGGDAITWDFTNRTAQTFENNKSYSFTATDGTTEMRYTAGSSCGIVAKSGSTPGYLKENGSTGSGSAKDVDGTTAIAKNRVIRLFVSGKGTLRINCEAGSNVGAFKIYDSNTTNTAALSETALVSSYTANTTTDVLTVTNGLWIETTTKGYITSIVWTPASEDITLTTTANMKGWRAFVDAEKDYTVDANTTIYIVTAKDSEKATLKAVEGRIPANTPVILKTTADDRTMTLTKVTSGDAIATTGNMLKVSNAGDALSNVLRLGYGASDVGFYSYTTASAPAGVIYLDNPSDAQALSIVFDDGETTDINTLDAQRLTLDKAQPMYNLAGQQVSDSYKGIVIVNGRKYINK